MKLKRILAVVLSMAMVLSAMSFPTFATELDYVAKIGETEYVDFATAMIDAKAETGAVEVEVYDKVTLNVGLNGNYSEIKFVGKDTDAEIYLDVQGYITATGKTVVFEDLKLSKSVGGFIDNAGFMNVAFGVYDVDSVSYNNCTFVNGAYASSGKTNFTECTFYSSHDKYGLWAYGNVDCTVDGCTFADYRGIKMYAEGAAKTTDLTVKNTDFSNVDNKPAIVLTYGESVTLEGNTYSSTGVFELDLDGAPNGTPITSDKPENITCKNDNGACGVLVDGKIYTTVTEAAAVATSGAAVTLLYDTEEDVTFAEGVTLNTNGCNVPNVKVEGNTSVETVVATIDGVEYKTLQAAIDEVKNGETIVLVAECAENVIVTQAPGVAFTIDGNDNEMTGTITVNGKSAAYATAGLIITNVNFVADNISYDACIRLGDGTNATRYTSNVTVDECTFTGTNNAKVAVKQYTGGCKDLEIKNCTSTNMHSLAQIKNAANVYVYKCTVTGKGGISLGASEKAEVRNNTIDVDTYGIRLDAVLNTSATLNGNTVNAYIPVCVRNATAENYNLAFNGSASSYTATNSDGVWCAICATEYEEGVALNKATGDVKITWNTDVLDESGVYGAYEWPIEVVFGDGYTKGFDSLSSAMGFGYSNSDEKTIIVHEDITEEMDFLEGNITTDNPNGVTIKNTIVDEWIYCSEAFTIGEGVTYDATGYGSGLFMYTDNGVINGTLIQDCYYQRYADTKLTINEPGSMTVKTETFILRYTDGDGDAGIYIVGDNDDSTIGLNASVIYFYQGMINAKDADIKVGTYWQTNDTDMRDAPNASGTANLVLDNSNMTVTVSEHKMKATGTSTVTLTNGSQLNLAGGYEGVNPSIDATSSITKNGVNVFAATVNGKSYATLSEAMKAATEGCTITLLNDATISDAWDCRYNGAKFTVPVTINGNGHTLKLTGAVDDKNWNTVFRFEADATVKNLIIDASEAVDIQRGISAKSNITVENCTFIGNGTSAKRAVIFGEGAKEALPDVTATITNSNFTNWSYGVSDNQSGKDAKSVSITDSTFTNASVLVSASETVTFTGNTMTNGYVNISSYSVPNVLSVTATGNTLDATQENEIKAKTINAQEGFITPVAEVNGTYCFTLEKALEKAADGDTITLLWSEGDAPIAMNGAVYGKTITITGTATVDWDKGFLFVGRGGAGNGTVIFDNANLTSASDSASFGIHVSGREKDTDNKYDGTLVIKNSTIELDYLINKGAITLDNSTLTVKNGFSVGGRPASETESGVDATATMTLNNNSKVIVNNHNGMGLGYEAIGVMNVNSGSTFQCTQNFLITEKGTMNIDGGKLLIGGTARASTGTVTLTNKGTINVSGTSDIVANVTGAGWVYMNGVTLDADTKLNGAKVRFASGTNNVDGSVIDNGYFQVGIGSYNGVDANVDTTNGVIVNVKNAKIGSNGDTYAGWVGTGFYDTDAEKAAAMTDAKYVLIIENSIAEFGYLHISNDGELNVNGNAAEKAHYNNSDYSFYAGDFIINGTATFDATDVLALYTKVSCDNGTAKPGTLNIVNGAYYEAERHNGAVDGTNFIIKKTGVVNVKDAELYIGEYTTIDANAVMNISGEVTARGAITNNGTINLITKDALLNVDDSVQVYGTFKSIGNVRGTIAKAADSAVFEITGGTYTQDDISDYVADGYKAVYQESTKLYYVFPDFAVEAVIEPESAVAGDTITVEVKVTEGGKYTNASWVLKYDPTYVTYDGTDAKNFKISGSKYDGATDDGNDEFDENTVLGTYKFTVNNDVLPGTAVFDIVEAEVHNYEMAIEFDGVEARTKDDSVQIGLKAGSGSIATKETPYNGAEQRGYEVTGAPAGARVTYSYSNDFSNGTQIPPAFVNVGEHTYYAKIEVDGYDAKVVEGKLTITAIGVKPSVEWSVAPESDHVGYRPVITGVLDETYKKGTVQVINGQDADGNDIVIETLNASDFAYDGHGKAVYTGDELAEISGVTSGEFTLTVKYTAGDGDNYDDSVGSATVNVDKSTIDEATENKLEAAIAGTGNITYDGQMHKVTVDEIKLPEGWTATVADHDGVKFFGDVEVVDVTFTDGTSKYNDYTATVMVKIVRREVTISVKNVTKKNGQADSEVLPRSYTVTPSIIGNDLGEIKIVRAEGHNGEIEGEYTITATYTPNNNYIVYVNDGKLTITDAVYVIEVVDNSLNGNQNKYADTKEDYTVGTRMILVHTDADYAYFTYNGKRMYDVSDAGYTYFEHDYENNIHKEGKKYQHVYAIVVEAEYGYDATEENEKLYADGVSYVGKDASYAPIKVTYDADINDKDALHVNDYSTVKGVYNSIYDLYQTSILKADYTKDKIVNTADAQLVKNEVIK